LQPICCGDCVGFSSFYAVKKKIISALKKQNMFFWALIIFSVVSTLLAFQKFSFGDVFERRKLFFKMGYVHSGGIVFGLDAGGKEMLGKVYEMADDCLVIVGGR